MTVSPLHPQQCSLGSAGGGVVVAGSGVTVSVLLQFDQYFTIWNSTEFSNDVAWIADAKHCTGKSVIYGHSFGQPPGF